MKQKILIMSMLLLLISCSNVSNREYTIVYEVYYNNNTVVKETKKANKPFYVSSNRGSNYIKIGSITGETVINTSAPIRILSHTYKENE